MERAGAYGNDCMLCRSHNAILQSVMRESLYYCRDCLKTFELPQPRTHWVEVLDEHPRAHVRGEIFTDGEPNSKKFTVRIPYSTNPTKWHPTETEGPFSALTRGAWDTVHEAREWAEENIPGFDYQVMEF